LAQPAESVALYWDFENLHAGLVDQAYGPGSYLANRFRPQDALIDVAGIVEFALSIGPIAINRAFANWLSFARYKQALLQNAVELIQVFPPGANAKNGADIKLCLDVMDDMVRFPHIGTIVVVGGDSDYMPLSYKVKAAGRNLVGIGSRHTTNQHWARSCHEFKFYETLIAPATPVAEPAALPLPGLPATGLPGGLPGAAPGVQHAIAAAASASAPTSPDPYGAPAAAAHGAAAAQGAGAGPGSAASAGDAASFDAPGAAGPAMGLPNGSAADAVDTDELRQLLDVAVAAQARERQARELVARAITRLGQMRGETWIQKARLRPYIQRMDPTFHEAAYGYASFNELLASMGDLIETRRGEFDHELRLAPGAPPPAGSPVAA